MSPMKAEKKQESKKEKLKRALSKKALKPGAIVRFQKEKMHLFELLENSAPKSINKLIPDCEIPQLIEEILNLEMHHGYRLTVNFQKRSMQKAVTDLKRAWCTVVKILGRRQANYIFIIPI